MPPAFTRFLKPQNTHGDMGDIAHWSNSVIEAAPWLALLEAGKCEENSKDPSRLGQSDRFTSEAKTRETIRGVDRGRGGGGGGGGGGKGKRCGLGTGQSGPAALRPERVDGDLWPCKQPSSGRALYPCSISTTPLPPTPLPTHISCGDARTWRPAPRSEAFISAAGSLCRSPHPAS